MTLREISIALKCGHKRDHNDFARTARLYGIEIPIMKDEEEIDAEQEKSKLTPEQQAIADRAMDRALERVRAQRLSVSTG